MYTKEQHEALIFCRNNAPEIRLSVRAGNEAAVHLWGAYIGAKQVRTNGANNWLVEKYNEYRQVAHA
jgi:hypothetical protein